MTDATERAREVVVGLTGRQKAALLASDTTWQTSAEIGSHGATLNALCFPPLTPDLRMPSALMHRDYMDSPLRYIYKPTDLGLAVRRILEADNPAHP